MNRIMVTPGIGLSIVLSGILFSSAWTSSACAQSEYWIANNLSIPGTPEIRWHESLESGWRESRASGRPMVIFITADQCPYCDAMKDSTWCESSVRSRIEKGFVAIRLNPRVNAQTLGRIKVPMYPTTLIGLPAGKVISHRAGFQHPSDLHQLLSEAADRILSRRDASNPAR